MPQVLPPSAAWTQDPQGASRTRRTPRLPSRAWPAHSAARMWLKKRASLIAWSWAAPSAASAGRPAARPSTTTPISARD